jgi:hypothetical protein
MDDLTTTLPDDPDALKALVLSLGAQVRSLEAAVSTRQLIIETLQIQLAALRRQRFGRKSEKLDEQIAQLELKLEEFQADEAEDPAPATEAVKPARAKRARKPLPDHLLRDTVTYPAPTCDCPNCGGALAICPADGSTAGAGAVADGPPCQSEGITQASPKYQERARERLRSRSPRPAPCRNSARTQRWTC